MNIKNIFIDLDRTLWDFDANSKETIQELFLKYKVNEKSNFEEFFLVYKNINDKLWEDYRNKQIEKDILIWKRFYLSQKHFGIENIDIAKNFGEDYLTISPQKTKLIPYAIEILEYLHKSYNIFLVTNGFKEVQYLKIKNTNLEQYFDKVFTSEEVGCNKPNPCYFDFVIEKTKSNPAESVMIGDDINVDIIGAKAKGLKTIWCNFSNASSKDSPDFEVKSLLEIKNIL